LEARVTLRPDLLLLLLALGLASYACRIGGFWLMRFVAPTPRLEAALRAAPLAVMVGIVAPVAVRGGPADWLGLAVTAIVMRCTGNDLMATLAGVTAVAVSRALLG
jgi:uncharacterized membrane protein